MIGQTAVRKSLGCILVVLLCTIPAAHSQVKYTIETIAGSGRPEFAGDGGPARLAAINGPTYIVVSVEGTILFSDTNNNRIRAIDSEGMIRTIAGDGRWLGRGPRGDGGPATNASMTRALGIFIDNEGNVIFADSDASKIRKIDKNGMISTIIGDGYEGRSGDGALAKDAEIDQPCGLFMDNVNNLYIADFDNHRIRKVDPSNIIQTVAGGGKKIKVEDGDLALSLNFIQGIADVAVDGSGNVAFAVGSAVLVMDPVGKVRVLGGNPLVGNYHESTGSVGTSEFNTPLGIAFDGAGNLFVADTSNHQIKMIDKSGRIEIIAGTGKPGYSGDGGYARDAMLESPWDVYVDKNGYIYFTDFGNNRVRKLSR